LANACKRDSRAGAGSAVIEQYARRCER